MFIASATFTKIDERKDCFFHPLQLVNFLSLVHNLFIFPKIGESSGVVCVVVECIGLCTVIPG